MNLFMNQEEERAFAERLVRCRRDFHKHPESGFAEFRTTVKIMERLEELGIPTLYGREIHCPEQMRNLPPEEERNACAERAGKETGRWEWIEQMAGGFTGCVGVIEGAHAGPVTGFRFDIDCNGISESGDMAHVPAREGFASRYEGHMHACGHDGHAAIGLGVAELLMRHRDRLHGCVKLIFQPAEEGVRGAYSMVGTSLFDDMDYLFGGHIGIRPAMKVGEIAASTTKLLGSATYRVCFHGKAAHCAGSPERGNNALAAAASAALNMLAIPRHSGGMSRVNVGCMTSVPNEPNIIPEQASMLVEVRGENTAILDFMTRRMEQVGMGAAQMWGCTMESQYYDGVCSADCDSRLTRYVETIASGIEGIRKVHWSAEMGAGDDIAHMIRAVQSHGGQGTYLILGADLVGEHHSSRFDFDEGVLLVSAKLFAELALEISNASRNSCEQ